MTPEVSFVITTPRTLDKSRMGGILARLLSRPNLELIAAAIITPDRETAGAYADSIMKHAGPYPPGDAELLADYVRIHFAPRGNRPRRAAVFLFQGDNITGRLSEETGAPSSRTPNSRTPGTTIRDTYADLVRSENGELTYFEPGILTPRSASEARDALGIFADFMAGRDNLAQPDFASNPASTSTLAPNSASASPPDSASSSASASASASPPESTSNSTVSVSAPDSASNSAPDSASASAQRTLVILKPDNWRRSSVRPGFIIDMLSRTGLRIAGMKVHYMSAAQALEFYGEVKTALEKRLAPSAAGRAASILENEFGMSFSREVRGTLEAGIGRAYAHHQFGDIVEFMTGRRPEDVSPGEADHPGSARTMILVYEGENAVEKIRRVLGPTNPGDAPGGTVRADFGRDIMVNAAHASDSPESARREFGIVKVHENDFPALVHRYLSLQPPPSAARD